MKETEAVGGLVNQNAAWRLGRLGNFHLSQFSTAGYHHLIEGIEIICKLNQARSNLASDGKLLMQPLLGPHPALRDDGYRKFLLDRIKASKRLQIARGRHPVTHSPGGRRMRRYLQKWPGGNRIIRSVDDVENATNLKFRSVA